jgi:hypothetical protein
MRKKKPPYYVGGLMCMAFWLIEKLYYRVLRTE